MSIKNKKTAYLSSLAGKPLIRYLLDAGFHVKTLAAGDSPVYDAVSTHADIHMCQLGLWDDSCLFMGNKNRLGHDYPGNIIYNAVCTGKYFIHNLKYTDSELLRAARDYAKTAGGSAAASHAELAEIHVRQGYTRCCCLPVDDTSFITSDNGIASALRDAGADVLTIDKGNILLPGFDYGFIGGTAGHIVPGGRRAIIFNGDLSALPEYKKITGFISSRDIDIISFDEYPLTDIGSILVRYD